MSAPAPMWVRVGGGMESVPEHVRHGPADLQFPPPGENLEALVLNGRLVGWAEQGGLRAARQAAETGQRLAHDQRDYLLGRLGHKLRSPVLALQESARQPGRPRTVAEQGEHVIELIVVWELGGWVAASRRDGVDVYLPACRPRWPRYPGSLPLSPVHTPGLAPTRGSWGRARWSWSSTRVPT